MGGLGHGGEASGGSSGLTEDTVITLTAAMTDAERRAAVAAVPKWQDGFDLTFQIADGDSVLLETLVFEDFLGGTFNIIGNAGESGQHTNQAAIFSATGIGADALLVRNCSHGVVRNVRFNNDSSGAYAGIRIVACRDLNVEGCYALGNGLVAGAGFFFERSESLIKDSLVSQNDVGIQARGGKVTSWNNDDVNTLPDYALLADQTGTIGKIGTQPSGTVAGEEQSGGGVIRA